MVELQALIPGIVGAAFGALGWLFVGLYIQRRQSRRLARNAARAVHIELEMNRLNIIAARDYGAFAPLSRSAFERLLPELATWLVASDLRTLAAAYMSHAGYEQARLAPELPESMQREALAAIVVAHDTALALMGRLAFTRRERRGSAAPELRVTDLGGGAD
jgi:signal transduction histidine kinase